MSNNTRSGWSLVADSKPYSSLQNFNLIDVIYIYSLLLIFGMLANAVNVFVFSKMDLNDTTNISLLALSLSDFCFLAFTFLVCSCYFPVLQNVRFIYSLSDMRIIIFGRPYYVLKRTSNWITAFITCERCLCIVRPIKVRDIITPQRSVVILIVIGVTMVLTSIPMFLTAYYQIMLNTATNQTVSVSTNFILQMESLSGGIAFAITILTLTWSIVCTAILVLSLNANTKWRTSLTPSFITDTPSSRDRKVIKMVTFILIIFLVAFFPECLIQFAQAIEPELSLYGAYRHLTTIFLGATESLFAINASMNIFVYLKMSSKYRQSFKLYVCSLK